MLGITLLGGDILRRLVLSRIIFGIAGMVFLAIFLGVAMALLLIGSFFLLYQLLLSYGVGGDYALLILGGVGTVLALILSALTLPRLRILFSPPTPASRLSGFGNAFIDGLMTPAENKNSKN
jgi:hypothetical protein